MDTLISVRVDNDTLRKLDLYRTKFMRSRSNAVNFILDKYLSGISETWKDEVSE